MDSALASPIYADMKFWSMLIALAALVLSLIPHLQKLRKGRLVCEVHEKINISHYLGSPRAQLHILLSNSGGRSVQIRKLELSCKRPDEPEFLLKAGNYFQNPSDQSGVLLTPFRLKPGEEWSHVTGFYAPLATQDEKYAHAMTASLQAHLQEKVKRLPKDSSELALADREFTEPLTQFFEKKFNWSPADYIMTLRVYTDKPETGASTQFRAIIFESDTQQLRQAIKHYPTGEGIYWGQVQGAFISLSEI